MWNINIANMMKGLEITGIGMAGVFLMLLILYVCIKIMGKLGER